MIATNSEGVRMRKIKEKIADAFEWLLWLLASDGVSVFLTIFASILGSIAGVVIFNHLF